MSWHYATRDVPFLKDYATAVTYESNVKPIRGRSPEVKPLGSRKKYCYNIKKVDDGKGGVDIHIRYDTEPMIIFRSDGYIVVRGFANYASTHGVQGKILGANLCQHDYGPWISRVLAPCDPDGDMLGAFPLRAREKGDKEENLFRREADGRLRYVNPLYPTQHVVKRKEMSAVRKKYPDFRKFGQAMIKVQGEGTPITEAFMAAMWGSSNQPSNNVYQRGLRIHYPYGRTPEDTLELIESGDSAKWADAATYLCWVNYKWHATWDLGVFKGVLARTLMTTHADEVFEKKVITTGKWVKNPNGKFFR